MPSIQTNVIVVLCIGFNNWSKALEKKRGIVKHNESTTHASAESAYRHFMDGLAVDHQLSEEAARAHSQRDRQIQRNRSIIQRIFNVVRFLGRLSLPFRGHDESDQSLNRGVFRELISYLADHGDLVLKDHLSEAAANATYLSPNSQNEMICIVGQHIQLEIVDQVKKAGVFTVMMDETTDVSHKEQVAILVRYVHETDTTVAVEERLLGVIDTADTTGEALCTLLVDCLTSRDLSVKDIVGQGYDGGANMRGASKGVQARILKLNPVALFTHCFAHNLNRALVNAACDTSTADARNFFGVVELVYTFVEGSAARHAYFIKTQREYNNDEVPLHLVGLSDTRWNCRANSLRRLSNEKVLQAVIATIDHVSSTTTEGSVRGTAAGLITSVRCFKFLLSLYALTPVLEAVNSVSELLQSSTTDILTAQQQIRTLGGELRRLRSDNIWGEAISTATTMAKHLNVNAELPEERQRKLPRKLDENPANAAIMSPMERMKINFYFGVIDKLIVEIDERFPPELTDFAFLEPNNFGACDAEIRVRKLACRYNMFTIGVDKQTGRNVMFDPNTAVTQWRLAHQFITPGSKLSDVYKALPKTYIHLPFLYKVLLTLSVTTASVERSFSKLALVKSKLRSTMSQERLEALLLSAVEKDLLLGLKDANLAAAFATKADRRMLLC